MGLFRLRIIGLGLDGIGDDPAHVPEVLHKTGGLGLNHDVTDRGAFDRSADDRDLKGIGSELADKLVGRTATDHVEFFNLEIGIALQQGGH